MTPTQRYALAGYPIDASPSPAMHNAAFASLSIDAHYSLRPTRVDDVPQLAEELTAGHWQGLNITTPLKTHLLEHVAPTPRAQRAGAVNTIWRPSNTNWSGDLTDIDGIMTPLQQRGVEGGEALILGAGGACRAAVLALEALGCTVHMAARRPQEAQRLLDELMPKSRGNVFDLQAPASLNTLFQHLEVLIQGTPVGRQGEAHTLPWDALTPPFVAFEMLYLPRQTPFLGTASQCGGTCVEGWEMLLHQGKRAFEHWTQQTAPEEAMREAILHHMSGYAEKRA